MAKRYLVFEATATEPEALEEFLNDYELEGWRVVSILAVPAGSTNARVGRSSFRRMEARGFRTGRSASVVIVASGLLLFGGLIGLGGLLVLALAAAAGVFSSDIVTNLWVTLERTTDSDPAELQANGEADNTNGDRRGSATSRT